MFKRKYSFHNFLWNKGICSTKNSIPIHQKANDIYKVTYPDCNEYYVRKTDRSLVTRWNEHAFREDQPMHQHLTKCEHFAHIIDSLRLPDIDVSTKDNNNKQHFVKAAISNFHVLDTFCSWSQLRLLEGLYIKNLAAKINDGLKATSRACFISIEQPLTYIDVWWMVGLVQWLFCGIRTNSCVNNCFIKV